MAKESRFSKSKYNSLDKTQKDVLKQVEDLYIKIYGKNWKDIKLLMKKRDEVNNVFAQNVIQDEINQLAMESLQSHSPAKIAQYNEAMIKLGDKFNEYEQAIYKVLNKDTKKFLERYAKKLFDISVDTIVVNLADKAVKFGELSDDERLDFLQILINNISKQLKVAPIKIDYRDLPNGVRAMYNPRSDKIFVSKEFSGDLQYVTGMVLHEFTHYLYWKHDSKTPVGRKKVTVIRQHTNTVLPKSDRGFEEYKKRPHEAPAYYVQDYFQKHKFGKCVLLKIKSNSKMFKSNLKHTNKKGLYVLGLQKRGKGSL